MVNKITVVGAGNVGATTAQRVAEKELAGTVVVVDVVEGIPQGKGLDQWQSAPIEGFDSRLVGTNGYDETADSDLVIITAGIARKPGMSRDDLLNTNAGIVKSVAEQIKQTSPNAIPVTQLMSKEKLDAIVDRTRNGGAEIVKHLKTGSAYYAPSAGAVQMAEAIVNDQRRILPCAAWLQGEYGMSDLFLGVPCKLGRKGLEKVIEVELTSDERAALEKSAEAVREPMRAVKL